MINEYKIKSYRGIDDLQCEVAWRGSSQGDKSWSNNVKDNHDWMIFNFRDIDPTNQEAINIEIARKKEENQNYIKQLKKEGRYGEEYELTIHLKHNPLFDNRQSVGKVPLESYKLLFIDEQKIVHEQ